MVFNFLFKTITKILANRLGFVSKMISAQYNGSMKGRKLCIVFALLIRP